MPPFPLPKGLFPSRGGWGKQSRDPHPPFGNLVIVLGVGLVSRFVLQFPSLRPRGPLAPRPLKKDPVLFSPRNPLLGLFWKNPSGRPPNRFVPRSGSPRHLPLPVGKVVIVVVASPVSSPPRAKPPEHRCVAQKRPPRFPFPRAGRCFSLFWWVGRSSSAGRLPSVCVPRPFWGRRAGFLRARPPPPRCVPASSTPSVNPPGPRRPGVLLGR